MRSDAITRRLTEVGPGSAMGELLRRYWHPIAAVAELEDNPVKAVRLLGEDLVLYQDRQGRRGLLDRRCPHRGADLCQGYTEMHGLRCHYHGWLLDEWGGCMERPFDAVANPDARNNPVTKSYRVEALGGLLWAYLGPVPAPLVPNWEPFTWKNGFVQIVSSVIPCNWFQCQENSIDPVHFEWLHSNWSARLRGGGAAAPRHLKVDFREFEYGFTYHRLCEDFGEDHPMWTVGRVCVWPNALFANGHFEWRVPIDGDNTLSVGWFFDRVPQDREPFEQTRTPYWYGPVTNADTGRPITSHVMNQDFAAWIGQGRVVDRRREHLSMSDRGIVMMRRRFLEQIETVASGGEPKGIVRDAELNRRVPLPVIGRELYEGGLPREALEGHFKEPFTVTSNRFIFQAGQPEEVRRAYEKAMGFEPADKGFVRSYRPDSRTRHGVP